MKDHAAEVLYNVGLTVPDATRTLLTRIANDGVLPFAFATYPATYGNQLPAKVQETLDDLRPAIAARKDEAHSAQRLTQFPETAF